MAADSESSRTSALCRLLSVAIGGGGIEWLPAACFILLACNTHLIRGPPEWMADVEEHGMARNKQGT